MKVVVDKRFTDSQQSIQHDYELTASEQASLRFRDEVDEAIDSITRFPAAAGHLVRRWFRMGIPHRRRNLKRFPFFIVYAYEPDRLIFLWLLPSRSNPQNWFRKSTESQTHRRSAAQE